MGNAFEILKGKLHWERSLGSPSRRGRIMLKSTLKTRCEDSNVAVAISCEDRNEPWDSIEAGNLLTN
jgi:hypothetical protein